MRHTHATAMWDGGMRELALQKRLGHASPESIRIYTLTRRRAFFPRPGRPIAICSSAPHRALELIPA